MYFFRFTEQHRNLLEQILKDNKSYFKYAFINDYFVLESESDVEKCFDFLLDCFINNGLQSNDEPNSLGIEIEKINSVINHQFVLNNSEKDYIAKNPEKHFQGRQLYFYCGGNKSLLSEVEIKKYIKLKIPMWLEEKWNYDFANDKIEKNLRK